MGQLTTIGVDLAKSVFQVHGVSADGTAVLRRQLRRGQVLAFFASLEPCLIGIEACSGAQSLGAETRRPGPRGAADAGRLCEAVCKARQDRPGGRRGDLR
jgi:transposase